MKLFSENSILSLKIDMGTDIFLKPVQNTIVKIPSRFYETFNIL